MNFPETRAMNVDAQAVPAQDLPDRKRPPSPMFWFVLGSLAALLMGIAYADSLSYLVQQWIDDDNYSHGFFIPVIVGVLIWMKRDRLAAAGIVPSWWGDAVLVAGLCLFVIGELATLMIVAHMSFWLVLVG